MDKLKTIVQKLVDMTDSSTPHNSPLYITSLYMLDLLYKYDYTYPLLVGVACRLYSDVAQQHSAAHRLAYLHGTYNFTSIRYLLRYIESNKPISDTVRTTLGCFKPCIDSMIHVDTVPESLLAICQSILQDDDIDLFDNLASLLDKDIPEDVMHHIINTIEGAYDVNMIIACELARVKNNIQYFDKYLAALRKAYARRIHIICGEMKAGNIDKEYMTNFMMEMKALVEKREESDEMCKTLHNNGSMLIAQLQTANQTSS